MAVRITQAGGRTRRKGGAVSLSSGDVPIVTPARDPGVNVPLIPIATGSNLLGAGFQALGEVFDEFAEVSEQILSRRAAVDTADRLNTFSEEAAQQLRDVNAEQDFSQDEVLESFGAFLEARKQQLLDEHSLIGTPESLARLKIRLGDIESNLISQAAVISAEIGRNKLTDRLDKDLASLISTVQRDPILLEDTLSRWSVVVDDLAAGLDENAEALLRKQGPSILTQTAIERTLGAGDVAGAEKMLRSATRVGLLGADATAALTTKITDLRLRQNATNFKIAQFEVVVGRSANEQELLALLGVPQPPGPTLNITIPTGFAPVTNAQGDLIGLEPIPGGPAAREIAESERKRVAAETGQIGDVEFVLETITLIEENLARATVPVTGFVGSLLSNIGGTEAADIRADLVTVKSFTARDTLQRMRDASPTGGALGQVSEREIDMLENALGSLDQSQSEPQFRRNLGRFRERLLDTVHGPGKRPNTIRRPVADITETGIPQSAIDLLKADPDLATEFDKKYGAGEAAKVLEKSKPKPKTRRKRIKR